MKRRLTVVLALSVALAASARAAVARPAPVMRETDRVRLAEAFRLAGLVRERVWKGWGDAPFATLLVTPEYEFLVRHPRPSEEFRRAGYDALLGSEVYYRPRKFDTHLLATFPAVGGVPTIVIGQAENTSRKTSTPWVVTLLHEHFHQLQTSRPGYYDAVNALGLSRGDQTGMWMLNYAFPYTSTEVARQFDALSRLLAEALRARTAKQFSARLVAYLEARGAFGRLLTAEDYRYFSFQVWQEGVARYTEYRVAELAARAYRPSRAFRRLKDYRPFSAVAGEARANILKELTTLRLGETHRREAFYPLGAGEALLLDRAGAGWKGRYFTDRFYLDRYFPAPRRPSRSSPLTPAAARSSGRLWSHAAPAGRRPEGR